MTSLKIKYANEIAEAMAKTLGDGEFTSVFLKEADMGRGSPAFTKFVGDFPAAADKETGLAIWNENSGGFEEEEVPMAQKMWADKFGQPVPPVSQADDVQMVEDEQLATDPCVCEKEEEADDHFDIAADFTLEHLAKLADTLDRKGFSKIADVIDETMKTIASKKK